jgi:VanZ family protein
MFKEEKQTTTQSIKLFLGAIEETFHFKRLIPYWLPVWSWMVFMYFMSSRSSFSVDAWHFDILWHLSAFALLAFLIYRAFRSYTFSPLDSYIFALTGSFLYGIFDEVHQIFVPGRTFSVFDMLTDLVGIFLMGLFIKLILNFKKSH